MEFWNFCLGFNALIYPFLIRMHNGYLSIQTFQSTFLYLFIFVCIWIFGLCTCPCSMCMLVPMEGIRFPRAGVTDSCVLSCRHWELNPSSPEE